MFLFALIVAFLWREVENILVKPKDVGWYSDGFTNIYKEKDYYDILISGTSIAIANTNAEEFYLQYGIAATTIGEPSQSTCISYYSVEEALNYQSPKAILFDVRSLFYTKDRICDLIRKDEHYYVHLVLDDMKNLKTRYRAFRAIKEDFYPKISFWDYFSNMYYTHVYWENIVEENFTHELPPDRMDGSRMLLGITPKQRKAEIYDIDNDGEKAIIPACNMKYLIKMIELCKKKDTDLILVCGSGLYDWNWKEYNAVYEIAKKYDLAYLDINLHEKEIGMDWETDVSDGVHLNLSGSVKWTDYLGNYLKNNYDIPDRRKDPRYDDYKENEERFRQMTKAMEVKKEFESADDFKQYMNSLLELDKEGYAIFMAVSDDASYKLGPKRLKDLRKLGITKSLKDKFRYSFLAVIDDGEVVIQKLSKAKVSAVAALNNGKKYQLYSGGKLSGERASLIIDESEWMRNGRGINIVIYDKEADEVLSSVYFDTVGEPNPAPRKKA